MAKYIPLDAVVAEIEKKLQDLIVCKKDAFYVEERVTLQAKINMCKEILSFLDSFEVKEVDLEKEEERIWKDFNMGECLLSKNDLEKISKHFFELGFKAQKGE